MRRALGLLAGLLALPLAMACDGADASSLNEYEAGNYESGAGFDGALIPPGSESADSGSPAATDGDARDAVAPPMPPISTTTPARAPALCPGGAPPSAYLLGIGGTIFQFDPASLEMRSLGALACDDSADPVALSVTTDGNAYVLYRDGGLFEASLAIPTQTLTCQRTRYASGQLGLGGHPGITVGAGHDSDRLYAYGTGGTTLLALSDLSSFHLFQLGAVTPTPLDVGVDLKSDAYGRLFAIGAGGSLAELDPATGAVLGIDRTGFAGQSGPADGQSGTALMAYDGQLFFFSGALGGVSRYDVATKSLFPMGAVNQGVVAASATPCLFAAPSADAGLLEGGTIDGSTPAAPTNAFSAGDAWIGTYECPQGLTQVAVVIESADDTSVKARFDFDSDGTQGSYEMSGTFDPSTREATFNPGPWVSEPGSSWSAVAMDGFVDLGGTNYAGTIPSAGCGAFSVTR